MPVPGPYPVAYPDACCCRRSVYPVYPVFFRNLYRPKVERLPWTSGAVGFLANAVLRGYSGYTEYTPATWPAARRLRPAARRLHVAQVRRLTVNKTARHTQPIKAQQFTRAAGRVRAVNNERNPNGSVIAIRWAGAGPKSRPTQVGAPESRPALTLPPLGGA